MALVAQCCNPSGAINCGMVFVQEFLCDVRVYVDWTSALGFASTWVTGRSAEGPGRLTRGVLVQGPTGNRQKPPREAVAGQRP